MKKAVRIINYLEHRRKRDIMKAPLANFESTSMGDIAFLLLIFFIVTGSFIVRQGIFFSLPSKSSGVQNVAMDTIMEVIPGKVDYSYEEKQYSGDQIADLMKKRFAANKELIVLFRMPSDVPYERLTDSLSIVREIGVKYVSVKDLEQAESAQ